LQAKNQKVIAREREDDVVRKYAAEIICRVIYHQIVGPSLVRWIAAGLEFYQ
jgi:hypothetical protein